MHPDTTGQPFSQLFPATVAVVAAEDWMWQTAVCAPEEQLLTGTSEKRQREFRAGRHCAHAALARFGCTGSVVLRGEKGEPLWPAGFCGTIAHSGEQCAAAVARQQDVMALGLDIERHRTLQAGVLAKIATATEIARLATLQRLPEGIHFDAVLFSIKEATHKAYFPLTRRRLGFHEVDVVMDVDACAFAVWILRPGRAGEQSPAVLQGRFVVDAGYVYTGIALVADGCTG